MENLAKTLVVDEFSLVRQLRNTTKFSCSDFCDRCPYTECFNKLRLDNLRQFQNNQNNQDNVKNYIDFASYDTSD